MEHDGKVRMLRIWQMLREETDAEHPLTTAEIERILRERWNIEAYRITIRNDIAALIAAGFEIEAVRSTQNRYYMESGPFELPELKLLIDAVECGKFITERKSRVLVEKLVSLANIYDAASLKRNICLTDRVKSGNEQMLYIMDALNAAINGGKKVRFLYFEYGAEKRKMLKNGGAPYVLSPYTLTWNGDYYYVVGWSEKHGALASFRIDRIYRTPELLEERAVPKPKHFSVGDFAKRSFRMFGGETMFVELRCENETMNTVIDHFGEKLVTVADGENHFRCVVDVSLSPTFFAWIFEFGGRIQILSPQPAIDAYRAQLRRAAAATD